MPLGYNNIDLIIARMGNTYDSFATQKVNAGLLPSSDMADLIRENVMIAAPPGL